MLQWTKERQLTISQSNDRKTRRIEPAKLLAYVPPLILVYNRHPCQKGEGWVAWVTRKAEREGEGRKKERDRFHGYFLLEKAHLLPLNESMLHFRLRVSTGVLIIPLLPSNRTVGVVAFSFLTVFPFFFLLLLFVSLIIPLFLSYVHPIFQPSVYAFMLTGTCVSVYRVVVWPLLEKT